MSETNRIGKIVGQVRRGEYKIDKIEWLRLIR